MDFSRALLNDASDELYHDAILLPYLKIAVEDLTLELEDKQLSPIKEESAILSIPVNTLAITPTSTPPLPSDFRIPIRLEERRSGGTAQDWVEMDEEEWEPEELQTTTLDVWVFRENEIKLRGATLVVDLKISYYKGLANITSGASIINDIRTKNPLAYLTAAKACRYSGENYQRYNDLMRDYREAKDVYLGPLVRSAQSDPTRRPGFRERERAKC